MFLIDTLVHAYPLYRASKDAGIDLINVEQISEYVTALLQSKGLSD